MTDEEMAEEWVISNTEIYDDKFGIEREEEPQAKEAYIAGAEPREKRIKDLEKENAEAKNLIEELASSLSVVGECDEEECELINKAQKFINKPIF